MQQAERSSARRLLGPGPAVIARRVAFFVAVVALWEILGRIHLWPEYLLPSPTGVARALVLGFEDRTFLLGIAGSLKRLVAGYAIATAIGLVIGVLLARVRWLAETLGLPGEWLQAATFSSQVGHCLGMAITSLRFFTGLDSPASFQIGAATAHDITKVNARRNIKYYFVTQFENPSRLYIRQQLIKTPSQNLTDLISAFSGSTPTPMTLVVSQNGSHGITPFAVEQRPNDGRVWAYDNNYPEISRTVYITPTIQSWSYLMGGKSGTWSGNPGNLSRIRGLGVMPISLSALPMVCPWCTNPAPSPSNVESPTVAEGKLWLTGAGPGGAHSRQAPSRARPAPSRQPRGYWRLVDVALDLLLLVARIRLGRLGP